MLASPLLLVDVEVVFARCSYLREVRHREDLHALAHAAKDRGDALGCLARDARIDLIEDDRGEATAVSDEGLDSEHEAGDFPTRSDLRYGLGLDLLIRGEEEGDVIQPGEGWGRRKIS